MSTPTGQSGRGPADDFSAASSAAAATAAPRDIATRFRELWMSDTDVATTDPDLLPTRLTKVCAELLHADGAGLSLFDADFRLPLGGSDPTAALAERLQFTNGEGPCLDAGRARRMIVADEAHISAVWPTFAADLFERTPFTAIIGLPVTTTDGSSGALDLFFRDSARLPDVSLVDATTITEQITEAMAIVEAVGAGASDWTVDEVRPVWLQTTPAHARGRVWIATGMAMSEFGAEASDALALLRSYAFGHDELLDDVAGALVEGRLSIDQLMP